MDPMKATVEAKPAYTAGVLPDPFVVRTFVDPAYTSGAPGSLVIVLPDMRNTNRSAGDHLGQVLYTCAVQN